MTTKDFRNPDEIIQLGVAPNRIDLMTDVEGLNFDTTYKNKKRLDSEDLNLDILDIESLMKPKNIQEGNRILLMQNN